MLRLSSSQHSVSRFLVLLVWVSIPGVCYGQQTFSDVPFGHPAHQAAEFLKANDIVSGYDDGTFQPDKPVNRAEALKLIIAPLIEQEKLNSVKTTVYEDIPEGTWYLAYVEAGRTNGIIDGPPKKTRFNGGDPVIKAEFLKMVQIAHGADPAAAYSEIRLPIASDVSDTSAWFYPYMRYALSASMTQVSPQGELQPGKQLTRGETAILLHRLIMYNSGRRARALVSTVGDELNNVRRMLGENNLTQAQYASARALIAARGLHAKVPDDTEAQGAVKAAESFRAVVRAITAQKAGDHDETIRLAGEAWQLSTRAAELSENLLTFKEEIQAYAKAMADASRTAKVEVESENGGENN